MIDHGEVTAVNVGKVSRRSFLEVAATGGLVLGFTFNPNRPGAAVNSSVEFNGYVTVASDGSVSIVVPGAELGQGVYTSLPKIVAEEMDADWDSVKVQLATGDPAYGNPNKQGRQTTGNSDAVIGYYDVLRKTGAQVREMLVSAAAKRWQVKAAECRAESGAIYHDETSRKIGFGEIADAAAELDIPEDPPLKDPKEFKLIGVSVPRKDTPMKVDGTAVFAADVDVPGKLYAALRTSPVFGGEVVSYEAETTLGRPGVIAIAEVDGGLAVIAETFWQAKIAADGLSVEFDAKGNDTWSTDRITRQLYKGLDEEAQPFPRARGDAPKAIGDASKVLEVDYETPFLAHACMEPMVATALVTEDSCTIWAPQQQQFLARQQAAQITGLPIENVILYGTFAGGGFGRKWEMDYTNQVTQVAMAVKGRPVSLIWTREEDMQHDYYRPAVVGRTRAGIDADGNLTAVHARISGQSILGFQDRSLPIPDPTVAGPGTFISYAIPNLLVDYVEKPNPVPVGFWRSVSLSHLGFFTESAIDEVAYLARRDPYEFRRSLLKENPRSVAVLDLAAEKAGWGMSLPPGHGMGIAFSAGFGSLLAEVVELSISNGEIKVERVTCAYDCGLSVDPDNVVAQMESGVVYGLTAALYGEITVDKGAVVESNFHDYEMVTMADMPEIDVHLMSSEKPHGGVGEAATAVIAPAVTNAVFSATGQRIRKLPIRSAIRDMA